ncbi:MAG: NfeD family protein [Candidatus Latescibacteria bacterium]|nr:NfeD family protein [Candidatus Latescibacterota bacterium]NIO55397.1 NfeD family protein [Candidatus Latescibacterota bacterium]
MPAEYWWIWMIFAGLLIVGEIFTFGFFLLPFGIGAIVTGLVALAGFGEIAQWVAFIVVSTVLFAVSRLFADRFSKEQPPGIGADRFTGQRCIVLEEINNAQGTGRIRLGQEEWRADSASGDIIPPGTTVLVTGVNGTHLLVNRVEEGE